jgi:enoyl-CoA hydratase
MTGADIRVEHHDHVAVVTIDDPERRNALSPDAVAGLIAAFDRLETDGRTAAVVVTGAGSAFCSGADTAALTALARADDDTERRAVAAIYEGFLRVLRSPLPTVAAVNGPAVGAGFNLALACDVRIASTSARFETRFLRIGLHPGGGHTWLLERAVGPQAAAALLLFGERIDGTRAAEIGLAWAVVPDDDLLDRAVALAGGATGPIELLVRTKSTLREAPWRSDFDAAVEAELGHQAWSLGQGWFPPAR